MRLLSLLKPVAATLWKRLASETGGATVFGLYLFSAMLMVGAYAIDVSNLTDERTRLQAAADSAAHAALLSRETHNEQDAIAAAVQFARYNLPPTVFGTTLQPEDVIFGTWDATTHTFTAQPGSKSAVRVVLRRTAATGNSMGTYLFQMVGITHFDLAVSSTFTTYYPTCLTEGFVAQGIVDIQSNDNFFDHFCIHSNTYVSLNSNNYFEPGTVVSMPDLSLLDLPNSGFDTNLGLQDALREGSFNIRILDQVGAITSGVKNPTSDYYPSYITNPTPITITANKIDNSVLNAAAGGSAQGRIFIWDCKKNSQISAGTFVNQMVIVANCEVNIGQGVVLDDAVLANTSTSNTSFSSAAGFQLGRNDGCAPGGSAQIVTMGGVNVASDLQVYGSQILTVGPNAFSARADGVRGASMISGSTISGTSNMNMSYCGDGMDNFKAEYFRMVN